jgi:hypothetical protein
MNRVLNEAKVYQNNGSYSKRPIPFYCSIRENVGNIAHLPYTQRHDMMVTLITQFDCRPEQYEAAKKAAERVLLQQIYSDVLKDMAILRAAVYSGHAEDVCDILDRMQENMGL